MAEESREPLWILRNADKEFLDEVTLSLTLTEPVHGLGIDFGQVTMEGIVTISGSSCGLILETVTFEPPPYKQPGTGDFQPIDYDEHGNLIVWHPQEHILLKMDELIELYSKSTLTRVSPNGVIAKQDGRSILSRYPPSNHDPLCWYTKIVLATGRGFTQYLTTVSKIESLSSGLIALEGTGQAWGRLRLTVDPAAGHLVRTAEFFKGKDEPRDVISTSGVLTEDGLTVPSRGTITMLLGPGRERATVVEFHAVSRTKHKEVIQHIKAQLSEDNLPIGTAIEDYRADPTSARPVRTKVGEK
ncbi:MAG: hypothetical protein V2A79_01675 [Planctomycetota bacterium]